MTPSIFALRPVRHSDEGARHPAVAHFSSARRYMITLKHFRLWPRAAAWIVYPGWIPKESGLAPIVPLTSDVGVFHSASADSLQTF